MSPFDTGVDDADDELVDAVAPDGLGHVEVEGIVAAAVLPDLESVDVDPRPVRYRAEVQEDAAVRPLVRQLEGAPVPALRLRAHNAGQRRLHREWHQDPFREVASARQRDPPSV